MVRETQKFDEHRRHREGLNFYGGKNGGVSGELRSDIDDRNSDTGEVNTISRGEPFLIVLGFVLAEIRNSQIGATPSRPVQ